MRSLDGRLTSLALALAAAASGCSRSPVGDGPHPLGAESFTSPGPGGAGGPSGGATAGPAAAPSPSLPADATTPARAVEEADVYARAGTTLLVLNAYRGLHLVDLADLSAPRLLARVAVQGTPIDLYLRGTVALVVVSDSYGWWPVEGGGAGPGWRSRLLAVDVAEPANPTVVTDLALDGTVEQTRLVGDVLYVVSRRLGGFVAPGVATPAVAVAVAPGEDAVTVASFDVREPARPAPVAGLQVSATGWTTHAHVTSDRITLAFTGWDAGAGGLSTRFQAIDISDPGGALSPGATASAPGQVQDRWAMDLDPGSGLFRAVLGTGWNAGAALRAWSWPTPAAAPAPLGSVDVPVAEALTAARFDGARVYLVTALRTDPLWVVDASDPAHPVIAGALQMPGQLDFIEPRGDRLVALGHTNEAGQPFQLQVSLLDVAAPASPKLLSRAVFGTSWGWVNAGADDLRKAFVVLDPPPAGPGLVLVPWSGWDFTTYTHQGGTQLLDWSGDALTLRGFAPHKGSVKRAFPADAAATALVALSDAGVQTLDVADRGAPRELARLDLSRAVADLAVVGDHAVELCGDWDRGDMELALTPALDPDAPAPLARLDLAAPAARLFQRGTISWILARDARSGGQGWLQAVDVSDPLAPRLRGRLALSDAEAPAFGPWWWGWGDEAVLVGDALAVHRQGGRCWDLCPAGGGGAPLDEVRVYDLSDPDRPALAATVPLPTNGWSWGLTASGASVWLTHWSWQSSEGRYFLDRIDLSDPAHPALLPSVNVPGVFVAASPDGARVYTLETRWDRDPVASFVHALDLTARGTARLAGSAALSGWPSGVVTGGGRAYITLTHPLTYSGSGSTSWATSWEVRLAAVALAGPRVESEQAVSGWPGPRLAAGGKLFLDASWPDQGLLVYDLADPAHPAFQELFPTRSWARGIVVADGRAYLPSGPYGVPVVPLTAP
ncbi:MAG TPA: beta-propeller domain-containing protein [Anaeromyxobacteraceae bacterium]|nr:beta-propeller domain-containing protein [Anaeromyxobacteraceae bacterium]